MRRWFLALGISTVAVLAAWSAVRLLGPWDPRPTPEAHRVPASERPSPGATVVVTGNVVDSAGVGVPAATVWVSASGTDSVVNPTQVVTGSDGAFSFRLVPKHYRFTASAPGLQTCVVPVLLGPDEARRAVRLTLIAARELEGRLVTPEGRPVVGGSVVAIPEPYGASASLEERLRQLSEEWNGRRDSAASTTLLASRGRSDLDGRFRLNASAGAVPYRVVAFAPGTRVVERRFVDLGSPATLTLEAAPWSEVRPRVRSGESLPAATVRLFAGSDGHLLDRVRSDSSPLLLELRTRGSDPVHVPCRADFPLRLEIEAVGFLRTEVADVRRFPSPIEPTLVFGSVFSGEVVAEDGSPVDGATISVLEVSAANGLATPRSTSSAADGSFSVGGLDAVKVHWVVDHPFHRIETGQHDVARAATVVVTPGLRLTGRVRCSVDGRFLADARVTSVRWASEQAVHIVSDRVAEAVTQADGGFVLVGLPRDRRRVVLTVTRAGYARRSVVAPLNVNGSSSLECPDISLEPAVALAGRVLDPHGTPLFGSEVTVLVSATGDPVQRAVTDTAGRFRFDTLGEGRYEIEATAVNFVATRTAALDLQLDRPEESVEIRVRTGARVVGEVLDEHGDPFPGARVRASRSGRPVGDASTDLQGRFSFGGLGEGTLDVEALAVGHVSQWQAVTLAADEERRLAFLLVRAPRLDGVVRNVARDPVVGARVSAVDLQSGAVYDTRTQPDGSFWFQGLGPGGADLTVQAAGYGDVVVRNQAPGPRVLEIVVARCGRVSGTVVDELGGVLDRFTIQLSATHDEGVSRPVRKPQTFRSDPGFELHDVPAGSYEITFGAPGFATRVIPVRLSSGEDVSLGAVRLSPVGSIHGRVVDERTGAPVPGAVVEAVDPDAYFPLRPGAPSAFRGARSNPEGTFVLSDLRPGRVELRVDHPGFCSARLEAWVGAGDVRIALDAGGTIRGVLVDRVDSPVPGARITLVGAGVRRELVTSPRGGFAAGGLSEGEYELRLDEIRGYDPDFVEREEGPHVYAVGVPAGEEVEVRWVVDLELESD